MTFSNRPSTFTQGSEATAMALTHRPEDIPSILRKFLRDTAFVPPNVSSTNEPLETAMRAEMDARNIRCTQLEKTLHLAASFVELIYHDLNFAEKKHTALTNWYLIYIDDGIAKNPAIFSEFEQRFLRSQPQLDPVLDALAERLLDMWEYYDPLCANSIISAVFEFISSECIALNVETLPLIRGPSNRFPWFQRERTGVAAAFAFMSFTKTLKINIMEFIQAVPDMVFWISVVNDVLSFYKEELAGEKDNYVHTRAYVDNKAPLQVLSDMIDELHSSRNVIHAALANSPRALQVWETWEHGYNAWHLELDRYKLKDLSL